MSPPADRRDRRRHSRSLSRSRSRERYLDSRRSDYRDRRRSRSPRRRSRSRSPKDHGRGQERRKDDSLPAKARHTERDRSPPHRADDARGHKRRRSISKTRSHSRERRRHRRRSRSQSGGTSSSSGGSAGSRSRSRSRDRKKSGRDLKDEKRKRKEEKEERRRRKKDKKDKKKKKHKGAVGGEWGQYGIISEADMYNKEAEFRTWLVEERMINPETISKDQNKKEFLKFVEDFNTATLPHEKYYDMNKYERQMDMLRSGEGLPVEEDVYDPNKDLLAHTTLLKKPNVEQESYLSKEQLKELRKVQHERIEIGKMKALGLDIKTNMGVRMENGPGDFEDY